MHFMDDSFVNLGEEVILTLLYNLALLNQRPLFFVISLNICYWLFKCRVLRVVCALARVCERERDRVKSKHISYLNGSLCVCVCVWGRERDTVTSQRSVQPIRNHLNHGLFANIYAHHHCVCHATPFPSLAWTEGKTKDIINFFTLSLKAEACDYGMGCYISATACGVRPITMHCASWPIRADCTSRKEGLCRKWSVWERWGKNYVFWTLKHCQHILLHQNTK